MPVPAITGSHLPVLTTDSGRFTVGRTRAGPGNDIHAGSASLQKAPTRGPASLVQCYRGAASSCTVKSAHNPTSVRCNAAPSESGSPGCNIGSRPRKQQMVSRFDKAHRGREPMVRIRFPPAESPDNSVSWSDRVLDGATGEALQAIIDLDLDELIAIQPPRGFGRD